MLLSCGLGDGCDFLFSSSVAEGFPLQRQNCTLVATGFFIKDSSIVTPQTSGHLARSWVIYRGCQRIFSIFPWMQPLIYTTLLKLSGMCSVCCTSCIDLNVINPFVPLNYSFGSLNSSAILPVLVSKAVPFRTGFSVRSYDGGWQHRSFFRQFMHFKWKCTEVPRALFNHMLLPSFSLPGGNSWKMWSKTAEK